MSLSDFARDKHRWLEQISSDPQLLPIAFKVAYRVASYINQESGEAWPSQSRLAAECHIGRTALREAIRALVARGHLEVTPGTGRIFTSRYRWQLTGSDSNEMGRPSDPITHGNGSAGQPINKGIGSQQQPDEKVHKGSAEQPVSDVIGSPGRHPSGRQSGHHRVAVAATNNTKEQYYLTKDAARAAESRLDEDPKTVLFGEGLQWLATKTERSESSTRSAIGQMLKISRDDAGVVLAVVADAKRNNRAEPLAWIMAALKARSPLKPVPASSVPSNFKLSKPAVRA